MPVVGEVTAKLDDALDALIDVDPALLADGETIQALQRQMDRLQAAVTRATAAFDASGAWQADGARSAAAWLAHTTTLPVPTARRRVRLGRGLRHMTLVEAAWLAGDIGEAQVGLLVRARTPATTDVFARDEDMLVGEARRLRFGSFARAMAYWVLRADPDGAEDTAKAAHDSRRLHLSKSFDGRWFLDGLLDPIGGSILERELRRIEHELFGADWDEAKTRVGEAVCAADLARTPAQRRADAVVEMARRSRTAPADGRRPEPLFSVLVGYETFGGMICQLADGTVVSTGSLVPYLDQAWVERVVFDGPSRVIDVGVRQRLFSGATRRAVQLRDRECFHDFCDIAAADCEVDHIQPLGRRGAHRPGQRTARLWLPQPGPPSKTLTPALRVGVQRSSRSPVRVRRGSLQSSRGRAPCRGPRRPADRRSG